MNYNSEKKDNVYYYQFSFTEDEKQKVKFTRFEERLIELCKKDNNISDKLLALQIFAEALEATVEKKIDG